MDNADWATDRIEMFHRHLVASRPRRSVRIDNGTDCLSCGDEIPADRRAVLPGCCLCVDCQEDAERAMGR